MMGRLLCLLLATMIAVVASILCWSRLLSWWWKSRSGRRRRSCSSRRSSSSRRRSRLSYSGKVLPKIPKSLTESSKSLDKTLIIHSETSLLSITERCSSWSSKRGISKCWLSRSTERTITEWSLCRSRKCRLSRVLDWSWSTLTEESW